MQKEGGLMQLYTHSKWLLRKINSIVILFSSPSVNFTNILHEAFTQADPKSAKRKAI